MLYSFPKAPRMFESNKPSCQAYYELPPLKDKRAASFGYGTKYDFTKGGGNYPAPNVYSVQGDLAGPKKGFSFGLSREQMAVTGGMFIGEKKSPGPGAYDTRESNKVSLSYSFRPRTNSTENQTTVKIVPGPGTYPKLETISPNGKLFVSKYKSAPTTMFSPANSKSIFDNKKTGDKPGPGAYNVGGEISPSGTYFVSKFKSSLGKTFGLSLKNSTSADNFKAKVPGPGSYQIPSDFGHYESHYLHKDKTA